jgi:hypothetical protein
VESLFLSDSIAVEDVLLEDNEKLISDCWLFLKFLFIDLLFVFELQLHR